MAINNDPFIQLQPTIPQANQLAYINDNFRKLSDGFNPLIFSDGTSNRVVIGKYQKGQYGIIGTDVDGDRRILIGSAPDDGRIGIWVSKSGVDVIDELGG
jgi:hypothetical protein